jgi:hypothetical protein
MPLQTEIPCRSRWLVNEPSLLKAFAIGLNLQPCHREWWQSVDSWKIACATQTNKQTGWKILYWLDGTLGWGRGCHGRHCVTIPKQEKVTSRVNINIFIYKHMLVQENIICGVTAWFCAMTVTPYCKHRCYIYPKMIIIIINKIKLMLQLKISSFYLSDKWKKKLENYCDSVRL